MWPRQPTPKFDGDRGKRRGRGRYGRDFSRNAARKPDYTLEGCSRSTMLIEFVERGIMYRADAAPKGERRKGERTNSEERFGGPGRSGANRSLEMHHNEIAVAIEKKAIESGAERKERGESEWRGRRLDEEAERLGWNGARIERALYSDKMILSIVNAAVGIAGL